ncbi:MAG TPA: AAA family ATPase [Chthonomonadaceae bacterium]|nr:AAA family ATPase [Chthonomonadaceae bacterium]
MAPSTFHPDIKQILEDLSDPAAYSHPVVSVRTIQTHVSCVFLTGDYAYKVKKPVDFGFLNYSTLELRKHYCGQELLLNRRLCPEIYLEIVPLTLRDGRVCVGGEGVPVEWAVRMRQLQDRAMLSACLVDAYERATEDRSLRDVLPFYQAYRACVRGNIALLAAAETEVPASERQRQREIAEAAYDIAWCYSRRHQRPALLITVGFSGSGKSLLARELCRRLPAVLISSDTVRKELAGVALTARLKAEHYTVSQRGVVYEEIRRRAYRHLQRGEHVLLDATFLSARERNAVSELAQKYGAEFWLLECRCPDPIIRQRLRSRSAHPGASDADLAVYEKQRLCQEPVVPPAFVDQERSRHLIVHTDQPVGAAAHTVVTHFNAITGFPARAAL